jgi:hypothetical protein
MGRFPGEESCLTLVWAVLDLLITHQTNGINFDALDRQRLKRARYQANEQTIPEQLTAAYTDHTGNLSHGVFTAAKRRHRRTRWATRCGLERSCATVVARPTPG